MKKCKECGSSHHYTSKESNYQEVGETCQNCSFLLESFWACVEALNRHEPINGKPRRITITGYKIERVDEN